MMTGRDKSGRGGPKVVWPTQEELNQWRELKAEHPWQLTLGRFLERIVSEYGFELLGTDARNPYLKHPDGRIVHLPATLSLEDQLDEIVTASLCRRLKVPPEDFGLMPEEPLEEDLDIED